MAGELSVEEAETIAETFGEKMQEVYDEVHSGKVPPKLVQPGFAGAWKGLTPHYSFAPVETGVPYETLKAISDAMARVPEGFHVNPKIERLIAGRAKAIETRRGGRLGVRRVAGVRLAPASRRPPSGSAARTAAAARSASGTPCSSTSRPATAYTPLKNLGADAGRALRLRQPAVRGRRARVRLRLLARRAPHADPLGGPVRRLRQRRPGDHRPVHRLGRVEVGPGQRPRHAPAARLRGPGARALQRPARTVPLALRRGQHPGRQRHHPRAVLPPAPPPGPPRLPQAPDRDDAQEPAPAQAAVSPVDQLVTGRFHEVLDDAVEPGPRPPGAGLQRQGVLRPAGEARGVGPVARGGDRPARTVLPLARRRAEGRPRPLPVGPGVGLGPGRVAEHGGLDVRRARGSRS